MFSIKCTVSFGDSIHIIFNGVFQLDSGLE